MKNILLLLTFVLVGFTANSQNYVRNNVYFDHGGAGYFYSVNYERLLRNWANSNVGMMMGFMYSRELSAVPILGVSYIKAWGKNSYLEGGLYYSYFREKSENHRGHGDSLGLGPDFFISHYSRVGLQIGYRHQSSTKGIFWNILFHQYKEISTEKIEEYQDNLGIKPWFSVGVGISF